MRNKLLLGLLLVMLISQGVLGAFEQVEDLSAVEFLEGIIERLESNLHIAKEGASAHPAFLSALGIHLAELYLLLAQLSPEGEGSSWGTFPSEAPPEHSGGWTSERDIVFEDKFAGSLSSFWESLQASGGSFERFAQLERDQLTIDVPAGNNWGVTGITSNQPLFTVQESMSSEPLEIVVSIDPVFTTSILVYISPKKTTSNPWYATPFARVAWSRSEHGEAALSIRDGHGTPEVMEWDTGVHESPQEVVLRVYPGRIVSHIALLDTPIEMEYDWLEPGTEVHMAIHSQGQAAGMASKLALRAVRIERVSPTR